MTSPPKTDGGMPYETVTPVPLTLTVAPMKSVPRKSASVAPPVAPTEEGNWLGSATLNWRMLATKAVTPGADAG